MFWIKITAITFNELIALSVFRHFKTKYLFDDQCMNGTQIEPGLLSRFDYMRDVCIECKVPSYCVICISFGYMWIYPQIKLGKYTILLALCLFPNTTTDVGQKVSLHSYIKYLIHFKSSDFYSDTTPLLCAFYCFGSK